MTISLICLTFLALTAQSALSEMLTRIEDGAIRMVPVPVGQNLRLLQPYGSLLDSAGLYPLGGRLRQPVINPATVLFQSRRTPQLSLQPQSSILPQLYLPPQQFIQPQQYIQPQPIVQPQYSIVPIVPYSGKLQQPNLVPFGSINKRQRLFFPQLRTELSDQDEKPLDDSQSNDFATANDMAENDYQADHDIPSDDQN